jgi:ABC-type multidrug transport system fused ATPase/permease subunit
LVVVVVGLNFSPTNQVLVIKDGEIIERGTHDPLLKGEGFCYNLYNSQFRGTNNV